MIDYEILKIIWWLLIGVLLAGFAVMDGQDMGRRSPFTVPRKKRYAAPLHD